MAIQTVVASYPDSYSPPTIANNDQVIRNNSFLNLETNLNPELLTQTVSQQGLSNSAAPSEHCKENAATESTTIISTATPIVPQAKPITSPCHSTTGALPFLITFSLVFNISIVILVSHLQSHPELKSPASPLALPKIASSTPAPLPSPHCLPDSTEDLC